jgi:hypothetical protein
LRASRIIEKKPGGKPTDKIPGRLRPALADSHFPPHSGPWDIIIYPSESRILGGKENV